ncbi:MAG: hypothetical protein V1494_05375 [Candidatus Diapherotrites archaeon]
MMSDEEKQALAKEFFKQPKIFEDLAKSMLVKQIATEQWFSDPEFRKDVIRIRNALMLGKCNLPQFQQTYRRMLGESLFRTKLATEEDIAQMKQEQKKEIKKQMDELKKQLKSINKKTLKPKKTPKKKAKKKKK